ncbi:MAG: hypothetical protein OEU53_09255 [Gammaproteobacteria bacterium]|nr:hypothetical protein [Gammaproteobacteria bacterium]
MKGKVVRREETGSKMRVSMYDLFCQQFDGVSFDVFNRDLERKNWVLLLQNENGVLCGFSSMDIYDVEVDGQTIAVVYSGDTVVDSETWSDSALSYYWMGAIDYLRRLYRRERLYWFLLVSGYRTYRFLPVYSASFYPRYDKHTPGNIQLIMDTVASARFGNNYNPETGVVRLDAPAILKSGYRGIPENRLSDPHIKYFAERNPGHERGDELVCFSILAEDELTRLGRRMWTKGRKLFPDTDD